MILSIALRRYSTLPPRGALGGVGGRTGAARRRARRYYGAGASSGASSADALPDAELAQRTRAYRDMLADNPTDESLWLQFIEFQVGGEVTGTKRSFV